MEIPNFNKKKFNSLQKTGRVCILQFWSAWCGDCFETNHLLSFQKKNKNVCVFRVNFEDNEELANKYSVKITPSYLFFRRSKLFAFLVGIQNEKSLRDQILG